MKHVASDGFTLVEVLVAVTVTTVLILVLTNFMMRNVVSSTQETTKATLLREIQQALDEVNSDIRISANADANNRNPDSNSPGGAGNLYGWTSNSSTLVLATAATTTGGTIIFTDPANYVTTKNNIVYFVSGGTLYRRMIAASVSGNSAKTTCPAASATSSCPADKALLHNVSNFSVAYIDGSNASVTATSGRAIELQVSAAFTQYHKTQTVSYKTRMVFRND